MAMIKNYLDLSRIEKDELGFTPLMLRLGPDVVEPVLAELSTLLSVHGMQVESTVGDDIVLEADSELLRVVYRNLVGKWLQVRRAGGRIRLRASDAGDRYRFEVWNEGHGSPRNRWTGSSRSSPGFRRPRKGQQRNGIGTFHLPDHREPARREDLGGGQEGEWINFIFELPKSQGRSLVS